MTTAKTTRVLIANGNATHRKILGLGLKEKGHNVLEVADSATTVKDVALEQSDLIVMNLTMPVLDGIEATDFARKKAFLVQNSDSGTILLGTFLDRCEVVVERASCKEVLEKMEECEVVFICLSEEAEIEEVANTAEKIAASEKPLPVCVLLMAPVDVGNKFSGLNVLELPLSLKSLAETFREITPPVTVEDAHLVET